MINSVFKEKLNKIKLIACDFDGVFTDGKVYTSQDGIESVCCSRKDGMGILLLKRYGIEVAVVSYEENPVVTTRCKKIGIKCYQRIQSSEGKVEILQHLIKEKGLSKKQVAFVGDDINDIAVLEFVGVAFTTADGHPSVKKVADYITQAKGGDHAVREIAELVLAAKGIELNKF